MPDQSPITRPPLPDRVGRLGELASDIWWVWNPAARSVFRELDYGLWRSSAHNPVRLLRLVPAERLRAGVARSRLPGPLRPGHQGARSRPQRRGQLVDAAQRRPAGPRPIAYFSAEFALHQSLPIYAGGLGVLAGDHCKEASDLGLPFVGIGFMYPQGYFHQSVSSDGWQEERYGAWAGRTRRSSRPSRPTASRASSPCRSASARCWFRCGTSGWAASTCICSTPISRRTRPGIASCRRACTAAIARPASSRRSCWASAASVPLRALGLDPAVWHLNEGHAGFVVLQRIHEFLDQGLSFEDALARVRQSTVFTTHTPVPAGHDAFPFHQVETHLAGCWGHLGDRREDFLALGRHDNGHGTQFNMTALALRSSNYVNAVSQLHGQVTREMWAPFYGKPVGRRAGRRHHQRRPPRDVGRRRRRPALQSLPRVALARAMRRPGDLGADPRHPRRRAVEAAGRAAQVPDHVRARARPRALDAGARQRRPRRRRRHAAVARTC